MSEEDASKLLHQLSMRPQGSGAKRGSETEGLRAIARGWEMEGRSGRAELSTDVEKPRFSFSVTGVVENVVPGVLRSHLRETRGPP